MNEMDHLDAMSTTESDTAKENSALKDADAIARNGTPTALTADVVQHRLDEIMRRYSEHLPGKDAAGRPTEFRERYRHMVEIKQKATRVMPECLCPVTCCLCPVTC